jgi:hypothetical protein
MGDDGVEDLVRVIVAVGGLRNQLLGRQVRQQIRSPAPARSSGRSVSGAYDADVAGPLEATR